LILHYTTQFKKDYKKVKKQNKDLSKLKFVIEKLFDQQTLESKYKGHQLSGNWKGHRDCHIEGNVRNSVSRFCSQIDFCN
jgi:mRNA interferase YafQ